MRNPSKEVIREIVNKLVDSHTVIEILQREKYNDGRTVEEDGERSVRVGERRMEVGEGR